MVRLKNNCVDLRVLAVLIFLKFLVHMKWKSMHIYLISWTKSPVCLRYVLRRGLYRLTEDPTADQAIAESRYRFKGARGEYYRAKYPKRRRPSEQDYVHEGFTYNQDAIAEVRYGAQMAISSLRRSHVWRMVLGQMAEQ